jgi:hypothetical protein
VELRRAWIVEPDKTGVNAGSIIALHELFNNAMPKLLLPQNGWNPQSWEGAGGGVMDKGWFVGRCVQSVGEMTSNVPSHSRVTVVNNN